MKCTCGNETDFYEKLVLEYNIPAREDNESHAGYGMPYDYDDYYSDTNSEGFYCAKCRSWLGYSLHD